MSMQLNQEMIDERCVFLTNYSTDDRDGFTEKQSSDCVQEVTLWLDRTSDMEAFLASGHRKEFMNLLYKVRDKLLPIMKGNGRLKIEVCFSISLMFINYINRYGEVLDKLSFEEDEELVRMMRMDMNLTGENWFESFEKVANNIFLNQTANQEKREDKLIVQLHEYINGHLSSDISLVKLAELVYLNPAYLSRIYKQITGANLSDYITNAKLGQAKKLLKDSRLKVHEIASQVGFDSDAYFIRTFKKHFGMPPQEYREMILKNQ